MPLSPTPLSLGNPTGIYADENASYAPAFRMALTLLPNSHWGFARLLGRGTPAAVFTADSNGHLVIDDSGASSPLKPTMLPSGRIITY